MLRCGSFAGTGPSKSPLTDDVRLSNPSHHARSGRHTGALVLEQGAGTRHQDVLLFFLSPTAIDAITTLTRTAAPHVAFLVRIDRGGATTA